MDTYVSMCVCAWLNYCWGPSQPRDWAYITPKSSRFSILTKHISFTAYEYHQGHVKEREFNCEKFICGSFTNQGTIVAVMIQLPQIMGMVFLRKIVQF